MMKSKLNLVLLFITVSMVLMSVTLSTDVIFRNQVVSITTVISPATIIENSETYEKITIITHFDTYNDFLNHIGFAESGNDYTKINTLGYLGKYQFGKSTLKTLKYKGTIIEFMNSSKIQETMMYKNLKYNKRRLFKTIKKYQGVVVNGITITESGMLAAAHLGGPGNVKRFFRNGKNPKDAYGSSITKYLCDFSGYNLNLK